MFKDKRYAIPCLAEWIMPWLVLIPGIPAIYYFSKSSEIWRINGPGSKYEQVNKLFHLFYDATMNTGIIIIFLELILALVAFIWLIISFCKKDRESFAITKPLILWLCPGVFVFGTLLLMFVVHVFTYGMGI